MGKLSDRAIAGYAQHAGFTGRELTVAVAVALAESGGDPGIKNSGSSASGLWQIMVSAHTDKIGGRNIFDPAVNAQVARQIFLDSGWSPWAVYNSGAYLAYLPRAGVASGSPITPTNVAPGTAPVGLGTGGGFIGLLNLTTLLLNPATYIRAAMFSAGALFIVFGLLGMTTVDNKMAKFAGKVGLAAVTKGKTL